MENLSEIKNNKIKLDFKESHYATGKRKTSIARIWIKKGTGKIFVNGKEMNNYFSRPIHRDQLLRPLEITKRERWRVKLLRK